MLGGAVVTTVLSLFVIANVLGNTLVCVIIIKNKDMRIPINYLLVNLAVSDIIYATLLAPKLLLRYTFTHPEGETGTVLCKLLTGGNFGWVGGACSAFSLLVIAIERYYAVMYPLGNKGKLTKHHLKAIIPSCWLLALIVNFPGFVLVDFEKRIGYCMESFPERWMAKAYSVAWFLVMGVIPLTVMTGLYSRVVITLWLKPDGESELTYRQKGVLKLRKRVTLMVVTVSVIYGVCWGTSTLIYLLRYFTSFNFLNAITITNTMVYFNSAVNPFVYALVNKRFRDKIKGIILRGCCFSFAGTIHPISETHARETVHSYDS